MAFSWANVLVAPTGSTNLDSGDHTSVDEAPPWNDADFAQETVSASATETAIFSGFDLSQAGGEAKGFRIWARMRTSSVTGFNVTITLKQGSTTLWTSATFTVAHQTLQTYVIAVPDSAFVGSDFDNLSLEFTCQNLVGANQSIRWSWLRISKSPFTSAQEAILPSTLAGQEFVCYRASDIGVLGGVDGESVFLIPDASGNGRHAILVSGTASTYQTDAPVGIETSATRYAGVLGFDPATNAPIRWTDNLVLHANVYPTSLTTDHVIFSVSAITVDFAGGGGTADKHLMGVQAAVDWVLMSGDGSGPAHLAGGTPATSTEIRLTEWIQKSGGNELMWENDDASPIIDGSSGDNPFFGWSLLNRENDARPWVGRVSEWWFVKAPGVSEADIDTARSEWVNGIVSSQDLDGVLFQRTPTFFSGTVSSSIPVTGSLFQRTPTFFSGVVSSSYSLAGVLFQRTSTFFTGDLIADALLPGVLFQNTPIFPTGTITAFSVTIGRVSRLSVEILSQHPNPGARVSRLSIETLSQDPAPAAQVSRISIETLQSLTIILPQQIDGTLFQRTVTFFTGTVSITNTIAGVLFQRSSTFFTGVATSTYSLSGTFFQRTPTFPTGQLTSSITVSGILFQRTTTFFIGTLTVGAVTLVGNLFTKTAAFSAGSLSNPGVIAGVLFQQPTLFFTGTVTSSYQLTGSLFQTTATFFSGDIQRQLTGTLFQSVLVFPTGSITSSVIVSGSLFQRTPTFLTGIVSSSRLIQGSLFTRALTFFTGTVSPGAATLSGNLYTIPPTFFGGFVTTFNEIDGQLFTRTPTFFSGHLAGEEIIVDGVLFTSSPTFFVGTASSINTIAGVLFQKTPTLFIGTLIQDKFVVGVLFQKSPVFFTAAVVTETAVYIRINTRKQDMTWSTDRP